MRSRVGHRLRDRSKSMPNHSLDQALRNWSKHGQRGQRGGEEQTHPEMSESELGHAKYTCYILISPSLERGCITAE